MVLILWWHFYNHIDINIIEQKCLQIMPWLSFKALSNSLFQQYGSPIRQLKTLWSILCKCFVFYLQFITRWALDQLASLFPQLGTLMLTFWWDCTLIFGMRDCEMFLVYLCVEGISLLFMLAPESVKMCCGWWFSHMLPLSSPKHLYLHVVHTECCYFWVGIMLFLSLPHQHQCTSHLGPFKVR